VIIETSLISLGQLAFQLILIAALLLGLGRAAVALRFARLGRWFLCLGDSSEVLAAGACGRAGRPL